MAFSPSYRVIISKSKQDITDHVSKIHYEDCVDEDDIVKISLEQITQQWIDSTELNKGAEISYIFGFHGGENSGKRVAVIKDFEVTYDETINGEITALDSGFLFKKLTSNRVFKDLTASEIVEQVAAIFGIGCVAEQTTLKHASQPVGNSTYWAFLQKIATNEPAIDKKKGPFLLFVSHNTLYFQQKDLSKKSRRTFTYGYGDGVVVSFKPKFEQKDSDSSGVSVAGVDPATNKPYKEKAEPGAETATGDNVVHYDVRAQIQAPKASISDITNINPHLNIKPETSGDAGKHKVQTGTTPDEAKTKAKGSTSKAGDGELTATLETIGGTDIEANDIITMAGVARKHSGNWYVKKVSYDISASGFTRELELNKTGTKKSGTDTDGKNKDANKTTGKDGTDDRKEVKEAKYDVNGKPWNPGAKRSTGGAGGSW